MGLSFSEISRAAIGAAASFPAVEHQVPMMRYLMQRKDRWGKLELTIDIADFTPSTKVTVAVMPYEGMKEKDVVEVIFQPFVTAEKPIGRMGEMTKTLTADDIDEPVVFIMDQDDFKEPTNLAGYAAKFYFTVTSEGEEPRWSNTQTVQILSGSPIQERLAAPYFEEDIGVILYPSEHPGGVAVMAPVYPNQQLGDIVILFDSKGGIVDWQFVTEINLLKFMLSPTWLTQQVGEQGLVLQMQYGGANRGLRSLPLPLRVDNGRQFTDPPDLPSVLTFFNMRAGLDVSIREGADISGGTTTMYITGTDDQVLLEVSVYKELDRAKVFTFAPEKLDVVLAVDANVFFTFTSPAGIPLSSPKAALKITMPGDSDNNYFPMLQVLEAQGVDKLRLPEGNFVNFELPGWPLMAAGQWIRIILDKGKEKPILVYRRIVQDEVDQKIVKMQASKDYFSVGSVSLRTTLYFNDQAPVYSDLPVELPMEPKGEIDLMVLTLEVVSE